jgi:hypothetical protein
MLNKSKLARVAAVPEAPVIQQPAMAIVPSPINEPGLGSMIGIGDHRAGVWMAK